MRRFFILIGLIIITYSSMQAGNNALGGRISNEFGVTFKHHYKQNTWFEAIADIGSNSLTITGLYEKYYQTPFSKNFNWFVGGGVYLGYWGSGSASSTSAGIKGVGGLCYTFSDIPVDISIDWMPAMQIVQNFHTDFNIFGLSVRYTF